ncbi:hypothetical protein A1O3_08091 [Capronia epimyces CBS 606.96]|uniref:tRNA(Phe) 7-[(3-amino-3-carboxypropyl)-4-demethylwyosine(37)-N(4)]-methyltransferase n=1 Tax=Capronia epimyces CBS 606.96 TaxID=1182542 RepID=W9XS39_9EURO|nr:uncharacterized protein A1O3_08091 [Capronia epimyces CBS 606.96]EXJ79806.1 hypothetical protein A1O3_08091 [Capronia epimyces CBS 606.96]
MPRPQSRPAISGSFAAKKAEILSFLEQPEEAYTDKSPKGTVDAQIRELIDEINAYDGLVTTSSCAGRVAVFVEGPKAKAKAAGGNIVHDVDVDVGMAAVRAIDDTKDAAQKIDLVRTTASPGGKGGGHWLYVSHDPISLPADTGAPQPAPSGRGAGNFTRLFNLSSNQETSSNASLSSVLTSSGLALPSPRLIHLSFSPLILHILCATLQHARPLLAAAINAGFRESGLQGLRILDDPDHGVMVAVRTAGLAFETVVGVAGDAATDGKESTTRLVSEEYLALCAGVVNERFRWNTERRERFSAELRRAMEREGLATTATTTPGNGDTHESLNGHGWEAKDDRRRRKREEGLQRQKREQKASGCLSHEQAEPALDELDSGLAMLNID